MQASDRGSGTLWVLAVGLVVLIVGLAGALRGAAVVARHRASAAADFAALAAALQAVDGNANACAAARSTATANGARMSACAVDGSVVTVTVATRMVGSLANWEAQRSARAGPAPDLAGSGRRAHAGAGMTQKRTVR